jgi:nitrous oxide reductase
MTQTRTRLNRRNFLLAASAGGVATAAAIVAGTSAPKPRPAAASGDKHAGKGYQVSEHINNYYRTTKV